MYLEDRRKHPIRSLKTHVDICVDSLQINFRQRQYEPLSVGHITERNLMIVEKMMNTAIQGHTFTKKIGQTVYVVRYHFNEDAKETASLLSIRISLIFLTSEHLPKQLIYRFAFCLPDFIHRPVKQ